MTKDLNIAWRFIATAMAFMLFSFGGLIFPLLATPLIWLSSRDPKVRQIRARKLVHLLFRGFIHFLSAMGVLSWRAEDIQRIARPNTVILANHPTLLDVVFLVAFAPNADCIVKGRLMAQPAMKGFVKLTGYITNNHQGAELVSKAQSSLNKGSSLVIFPEGTRTRPGGNLLFQRGAANILVRTNASVALVAINCNPLTLSKQHKWYRIPRDKFHLEFRVLDEFNLQPYRELPATIAARHLTRDLQLIFRKELSIYDDGIINSGNQKAHHQHTGA